MDAASPTAASSAAASSDRAGSHTDRSGAALNWLDSAHLARGIALAFALAVASISSQLGLWLEGPALIVASMPLVLLLAGGGLALMQGRLPAQRSVSAWLGWTIVGGLVALMALGATALLLAVAIYQPAGVSNWMLPALAVALAWAAAVLLNRAEAARAFVAARRWRQARQVLFGIGAAACTVLGSLALADASRFAAAPVLARTPFEALVPGFGVAVGLLAASLLGVLAWRAPRLLAQAQLDGRFAASAVGEAMWFAGLMPMLLSLPLPEVGSSIVDAMFPVTLTEWGQAALRCIAIVLAHGVLRLWLGAAGSSSPVPLLLLVPPSPPGLPRRANQQLHATLARLPLQWRDGPVIRLMTPDDAVAHAGTHQRLAAELGSDDPLFPRTAQEVAAWRLHVPASRRWRALPVQEIYAEPARFGDVLRSLVDEQTWVLCVDHGDAPAQHAPWQDALPPARSVRLDFVGKPVLDTTGEHTLWRSRPVWIDGLGPPLPVWLRARAPRQAPRRIAILHAPAQAALAHAIVAALDGRHDVQQRPVQAWALPQNLSSLPQLPLNGFAALMAVPAAAPWRPWPAALWQRAARSAAASAPGEAADAAFEIAWLFGAADAAPADVQKEAAPAALACAPLPAALLPAAQRRIGLRRGAAVEPPAGLDAQIDAPAGSMTSAVEAAWYAQRLLNEEWVGLAAVGEAPPAAKAAAAAPAAAGPATTATAATGPARPLVFISFHDSAHSRTIAHELVQRLSVALEGGADFFLSDERPGPWQAPGSSADALQRCTHFVPLLCDAYLSEPGRREQLFAALAAVEDNGRPQLLPVLVDPVDAGALDLGPARRSGELRSRRPALKSLAELGFAGPRDNTGALVPLARLLEPEQLAQVAQGICDALRVEPASSSASGQASTKLAVPAPLHRVFDAREAVRSLAWMDPRTLAIAGLTGGITLWQPEGTTPPPTLQQGHGEVGALCLLPPSAGGFASAAGPSGALVHWRPVADTFEPATIGTHGSRVHALCLAQHGGQDWLVAGDESGCVIRWPLHAGGTPLRHGPLGAAVAALDAEGERLFVALGAGGWAEIGPGDTAVAAQPTDREGDQVLTILQAGDNFYIGGADTAGHGFVQRLRLHEGGLAPRSQRGLPSIVTVLAVRGDDRVVLGLGDGGVGLWDASAGADHVSTEARHDGTVLALALGPGGWLASAGLDGRVVVVDAFSSA